MKKSLAMLMTLLFVLLGTTAWAQSYTAGVYTAQANGNNGPVTVEVEVSDAEIPVSYTHLTLPTIYSV